MRLMRTSFDVLSLLLNISLGEKTVVTPHPKGRMTSNIPQNASRITAGVPRRLFVDVGENKEGNTMFFSKRSLVVQTLLLVYGD